MFLPLDHSSVSLTTNVPKDARRHNIPHPFQKELGFLLQHISKSYTSLSITHPTPCITKAKFHISAAISQWRSKLYTFSHYSYKCNTHTQSQYCVLKIIHYYNFPPSCNPNKFGTLIGVLPFQMAFQVNFTTKFPSQGHIVWVYDQPKNGSYLFNFHLNLSNVPSCLLLEYNSSKK